MSSLSDPQVGFTASSSHRGTLDIIWSCLFTIFMCTWTVVHPNIPPSRSPWWHRVLDRLAELVLAAIAPELTLAVAVREWLDAKAFVTTMKDLTTYEGYHSVDNISSGGDRGLVTGFYIAMGGLLIRQHKPAICDFNFDFDIPSNNDTEKLSSSQVEVEGYLTIPEFKRQVLLDRINLTSLISEAEIQDKGKADTLIKCILAFQVLWLTTQCVARVAQHLTITPLEISTLAYVPFMLISLGFWWHKPYNVDTPTPIDLLDPSDAKSNNYSKTNSRPLTSYLHVHEPSPRVQPTPYQNFGLIRECLKVIRIGGVHSPDPARAVVSSFLFFFFGGLHSIAWNFPFPTKLELWLWRISSLTIAAVIPGAWLLISLFWLIYRAVVGRLGTRARARARAREGGGGGGGSVDGEKITTSTNRASTYWHGRSLEIPNSTRWARLLARLVARVCVVLYVVARLCLMVQTFVGLRSLPRDCYDSVEWLAFVPRVV